MIPLLILIGALLVAIHFIKESEPASPSDWWFAFCIFLFMLLIGGFVGFALFAGFATFVNPTETGRVDQSVEIYSLRNQQGVEGSFIFGSGTIGSTEYYYMFQKEERGGYRRLTVAADDSTLFQDATNKPIMLWQIIKYKYPSWLTIIPVTYERRTRYDIHVPPNTIIERYKIE